MKEETLKKSSRHRAGRPAFACATASSSSWKDYGWAVDPLIITSGDSAAELLRRGGLGDVIGWKDSPAVGPSPRLDAAPYKALRAQYRGVNDVAAFQDLDTLPAADHVVLLVDACPYDTGILVRLIDYLHPRVKRMRVRVVDAHPSVPRFHGLGQLSPGDLAALPPGAHDVTPDEVALSVRTWDALCDDKPMNLVGLLHDDTHALPHLAAALRRILQELPWTQDGLSRLERAALAAVAGGAVTTTELVTAVRDQEEPVHGLWCGDGHLLNIVSELCTAKPPLMLGPAVPLALTAEGRDVLAGRAMAQPSVERWVGGTRILPGPTWRWDDVASDVALGLT